jgi:hypothetical protein
MGKPGKKASNIFQNPGIKNNSDINMPILSLGTPLKQTGQDFEAKGKAIKKRKKQYADVIDSKGQSQLNKPVSLFFNSGTNRAHGMGGTMDKLVEGAKNLAIPGRYATKVYRAYKYNKTSTPR